MRRWIAIALMVGAVWVGLEVYQKGVDQAFGGVFAGALDPTDPNDSTRSLAAMKRVNDKAADRANRALGDERFRD